MNQPPSKLSRRTIFAGAGTVGAMAAASRLLPSVPEVAAAPEVLPKAPENGGGYSLTAHVRRYYQTTRI
jgi:hypothetical protein